MRVIAGEKRGLKLIPPRDGRIRPTADRVKEALFGSIQFILPGEDVLDLFSGSGALGIEALSRGANSVVLADCDPDAVELIKQNLAKAGNPGNAVLLRKSYGDAIKLFQKQEKFGIVFIDPPYGSGYYIEAASLLASSGSLKSGATVIFESDREICGGIDGYDIYKRKKFGEARLTFLRYAGES